jgi:hypothetical protein
LACPDGVFLLVEGALMVIDLIDGVVRRRRRENISLSLEEMRNVVDNKLSGSFVCCFLRDYTCACCWLWRRSGGVLRLLLSFGGVSHPRKNDSLKEEKMALSIA